MSNMEPTAGVKLTLLCGCGEIDPAGRGQCGGCDREADLFGPDLANGYCVACWRKLAVDTQGHGQVCDGDWSRQGLRVEALAKTCCCANCTNPVANPQFTDETPEMCASCYEGTPADPAWDQDETEGDDR